MSEHQESVAAHDEEAAADHRALGAEQAVRHPAAEKGEHISRCDVEAVDRACVTVVEPEAAVTDGSDRVENQDGAHSVIREAPPHLRQKKRRETAWLPEDLLMPRVSVRARVHD